MYRVLRWCHWLLLMSVFQPAVAADDVQPRFSLGEVAADGAMLITTWISPEGPAMPGITLTAELADPGFSVLRIVYRLNVSYSGQGRNDRSRDYTGEGGNNVRVNFGEDIRGGVMHGQARAQIRRPSGSSYWTGWQPVRPASILGRNPAPAAVRDHLDLLPATVIAYRRSGLRMFADNGQPDVLGGFGIARIANPSAEQVWHWKRNAEQAKADYLARREQAAAYPQSLRDSDPKKYRKLPDFTPEQLRMETYQSFSDGRYYVPKRKGLFGKRWKWVKRDDVNAYADECAALEKAIAAGRFPDGPGR